MIFVFAIWNDKRKPVVQLLSEEDYECSVNILFVNNTVKVIYDWNLSNYFWNVKMYIKWNNHRHRYNWGSNICTDHSIKYFCNYDFFPSFMWILSIFLIFLYMLTYIYSYDIMLEQMWNKHAYLMSHLPPPSTPKHITRL